MSRKYNLRLSRTITILGIIHDCRNWWKRRSRPIIDAWCWCLPGRACGARRLRRLQIVFRPKPRVPSLVGHFPRVSYVCLVGQSLKGRWWWWWWNGGTPGAVLQISWHLAYDWGKPRKPSVRKPSGALSSMTSNSFTWGPFPPNGDGKAKLPASLVKPIGSSQKSVLNNFRSQDPESATPDHSSTLLQNIHY